MFKLLQIVMEKEKADGTYRGRKREMISRRFGRAEEIFGGQ
jgi:hypothetical protein